MNRCKFIRLFGALGFAVICAAVASLLFLLVGVLGMLASFAGGGALAGIGSVVAISMIVIVLATGFFYGYVYYDFWYMSFIIYVYPLLFLADTSEGYKLTQLLDVSSIYRAYPEIVASVPIAIIALLACSFWGHKRMIAKIAMAPVLTEPTNYDRKSMILGIVGLVILATFLIGTNISTRQYQEGLDQTTKELNKEARDHFISETGVYKWKGSEYSIEIPQDFSLATYNKERNLYNLGCDYLSAFGDVFSWDNKDLWVIHAPEDYKESSQSYYYHLWRSAINPNTYYPRYIDSLKYVMSAPLWDYLNKNDQEDELIQVGGMNLKTRNELLASYKTVAFQGLDLIIPKSKNQPYYSISFTIPGTGEYLFFLYNRDRQNLTNQDILVLDKMAKSLTYFEN